MDADAARRRVFVLDASAAVADAIADVIRRSDHFELVGVTTRAGEPTIRQVRERHPDVVLVDYRLGGGALVGQLRVSAPTAQLLVSSVRARASERDDSLAAGANGYFEKRDGIAHLLRVMSGTTVSFKSLASVLACSALAVKKDFNSGSN